MDHNTPNSLMTTTRGKRVWSLDDDDDNGEYAAYWAAPPVVIILLLAIIVTCVICRQKRRFDIQQRDRAERWRSRLAHRGPSAISSSDSVGVGMGSQGTNAAHLELAPLSQPSGGHSSNPDTSLAPPVYSSPQPSAPPPSPPPQRGMPPPSYAEAMSMRNDQDL